MMRRKLRKIRSSRGAAVVEAVVVIPFFIIIFASMIFVAKLYGEKQRTLRVSKEYAWTYAMANCESGGANATLESEGSPMSQLESNDPNVNSDPLSQFQGSDPGMEKFDKSWGTASSTIQGSATASKAIGGFTNHLSTTTKVQCNEKPQKGNLRGVFHFAWSLFKQW
ncbi:MAG TPA: hypothetical protein PKL73_21045 [Polyangiaceae bacterium]|jgi:hypothetical protein|nr:hypothetical protein [Polyangiaceae bacterium]HNZ23735.1 hypothetical protein [Polyangiaceae bacterium]HOD24885.1 hypothetical protein [Polyangiaceae bacterium]HOE48960.1 hypothetical protein [Polyangiaceae bacterium]HOH01504.1 hypothetical protein [Polyangiaceae bacterium]